MKCCVAYWQNRFALSLNPKLLITHFFVITCFPKRPPPIHFANPPHKCINFQHKYLLKYEEGRYMVSSSSRSTVPVFVCTTFVAWGSASFSNAEKTMRSDCIFISAVALFDGVLLGLCTGVDSLFASKSLSTFLNLPYEILENISKVCRQRLTS